jgi:hypothetical protein
MRKTQFFEMPSLQAARLSFLQRGQDFVAIHGAQRLRTFEPGRFHRLEFVEGDQMDGGYVFKISAQPLRYAGRLINGADCGALVALSVL